MQTQIQVRISSSLYILGLNILTLISKCTFMHKLSGHLLFCFPSLLWGSRTISIQMKTVRRCFWQCPCPSLRFLWGISVREGGMTEEGIHFIIDGWHLGKGLERGPVLSLRGTMSLLALSVYVCLMGERVTKFIFRKGSNNTVCSDLVLCLL